MAFSCKSYITPPLGCFRHAQFETRFRRDMKDGLGAGPHLGIMDLISDKTNELLSENPPIYSNPEHQQ